MSEIDLSIIIPTYNRLPLLKEALDSFVGLLDCSYEVIVVDDGSTDGTVDFLRTLQEPYRVFFQEHKGGNAARNYGLRAARGRYIKFLDDDDWLIADIVDQQVRYLEVHQDVGICYSDYGRSLESGELRFVCKNFNTGLENLLEAKPRHKIGYPPFVYLLRSQISNEWNENLSSAQDFDFFLRLKLDGAIFGYLPGIVGIVRDDHDIARISNSVSGYRKWLSNHEFVLSSAEKTLAEKGDLTLPIRKALARRYFFLACETYRIDRDSADLKNRIKKITLLDPQFKPPTRRVFRMIARILGYEVALEISNRCAQAKRLLGGRAGFHSHRKLLG